MEVAEHIAALRIEGQRLSAAAASAGLDAKVPSCPDWVVRDLVRHQGGVHRWATGVVTGPRTEPWIVDLDEVVGYWPPDTELLEWFDQGCGALADALSRADPGLECWTFLAAPSPLAMWARRQAHETAVHRVDAELASGGPITPFSAPFAADGIDELLSRFVMRHGRRPSRSTRPGRCASDVSIQPGTGRCTSAPTVSRRWEALRERTARRSVKRPTSTLLCGAVRALRA
jgi:uncharacterized protein (TIGR03083 family)